MRVNHTQTRRLLVLGLAVGLSFGSAACDDDENDDIDPIPTDSSVVGSGLPTTDGSAITIPAPNPDAGGGTGSGTAP